MTSGKGKGNERASMQFRTPLVEGRMTGGRQGSLACALPLPEHRSQNCAIAKRPLGVAQATCITSI